MTFYGVLDAGFQDTENKSSFGNTSASGIGSGGMSTSRWGIRGTEDLGGGLAATFNLESEVNVGNGAVGGSQDLGLFNRRAVVGLKGNFGTVNLGRDNNPLYDVIGTGDVFGMTGIITTGLLPIGQRVNNMVSYETPVFGGFSAKAMVAQDKSAAINAAELSSRTSAISAKFANGPLVVTAGWGERKGDAGLDGGTINKARVSTGSNNAKQDGTAIAATYDFGVAKLFTNYVQAEMSNGVLNQRLKAKEVNVGVSVPLGAFTLMAAYGHNDVDANYAATGASNINGKGDDYVLGATYDMSKRTSLYVKTGTYNKISGNYAGTAADFKTNGTVFGLRHSF